jgi:hypothetical protein
LGQGYDVITSGYINRSQVKIAHNILDQNMMCQDGLIVTSDYPGQQYFETSTGSNIKEFYANINSSINLSLGSEVTNLFFSGNFKSEFSIGASETVVQKAFYSRMRSYRYTQDDYIKDATASNLSKYLTAAFVSDLKNKSASEILDQYGTHVFVRYFKGGSLEANYKYTGSTLTSNLTVEAAVKASFEGVSGGVSGSANKGDIENAVSTSFKYYTYGGKALEATSIDQLKNEYSSWVNSIASNADICGIGDFNQSFISIWDLARASGETAKATQLENTFKSRAAEQGVKFPKVQVFTTKIIEDGDIQSTLTLSYSGGTIAEIEIYAVGGGGGGQGGHNNNGLLIDNIGTGGAGGGGGSSYVKLGSLGLGVGESVSLNVTKGNGGSGGSYYKSGIGGTDKSGDRGSNGTNTTVSWTAKSIQLTARGGFGGGGDGTTISAGAGGSIADLPRGNDYFKDGISVAGNPGTSGDQKNDVRSEGGSGANIVKGTLSSFGGSSGAIRPKGGAATAANAGGGGSGGYASANGTKGGNGWVTVVVKYFTTE